MVTHTSWVSSPGHGGLPVVTRGLGCGHPDISPGPVSLSRLNICPGASLPRPEAAAAVAGLGGLGPGLALVADTRVGRGDHSTRLQKVFPPLLCFLVFNLLNKIVSLRSGLI